MKTGFVSIVGRPNVGKSTLLNSILERKIAITSNVSGTTRNIIEGIYNDEDSQIVFIDTPGIHKPVNKLGNVMNSKAYTMLGEVDVVLFLLDVTKDFGKGDNFVLNKIKDRVDPNVLEDTNKLKYVVRHYVNGLERHYDVDKLTDFDKVWLTYHFILDRDKLNIKFADDQAFYGNDGQQHLLRSEENWESKPYGTYIRRRGVCEGQARLFRILTNNWDMKIDAITLGGMSAFGPHCWLGTVIDDKLYYCCTTQHLLFDDAVRRGFVPDNSEYYPKIYEVSSLSTEDKRKIEGHIKSLKK